MSVLDPAAAGQPGFRSLEPAVSFGRAVPATFAAALFVSAILLFSIQPMFTRMVLPRLGGAPAVWSVAMVFFQAALLAGYAYAHLLSRLVRPRIGAFIHLGILAAAAAVLPIGIAHDFGAPPERFVGLWLIGLFAASLGLPFAALSASAPLLQAWFASTSHGRDRNPYVLYAASNLGSFAGLLAYPFWFEPMLSLQEQTWAWALGFACFAVLVALTAALVVRTASVFPARDTTTAERLAPVRAADRLAWIALAAIPSGLVVAVTAHLTTDVAAAPFLWVLPLALYLLTFVAIFRDRPWIAHRHVVNAATFIAAPLAISIFGGNRGALAFNIGLNLSAFFALTMLCHGALYARRPATAHLTEFYLWNSLGGVLGGVFAALLAPKLFNGTYEYPVLICLALLAVPGAFAASRKSLLWEAAAPLGLAAAAVVLRLATDVRLDFSANLLFQTLLVAIAAVMLVQRRRPVRLVSLAVLAFVVSGMWRPGLKPLETARSFFGVHEVAESADRTQHILFHGTTIHGMEAVRHDDGTLVTERPVPETYYYPEGPFGDAFGAVRAVRGQLADVAIVGLGAGNMACLRRDGENWTFFEIDPEVVRIASDRRFFRSLSECAPNAPVVLGDARLSLAAMPGSAMPGSATSGSYDLIALDAFTSDAIPVHLLTAEAIAGYLRKLKPGGVIFAHISNRHMDLAPVLAATASSQGLLMWFCRNLNANDVQNNYRANAELAVLARSEADLGDLTARSCWRPVKPVPGVAGWTDDHSDLLRAILLRKFGYAAAPSGVAAAAGSVQ